jgi:hypothetical protein
MKALITYDSFKLRFPISDIEILDNQLLSKRVKVIYDKETGEIIEEEEIQSKSLKVQYDSYQIHFAISDTFNRREVIVLVNSKLLEGKYLEGISRENISIVYDRLMKSKIVYMNFNCFMRGMVSDVDIKKDIEILSHAKFDSYTLDMERNSIAKKARDFGVNRLSKATNKGIEWNKRERATPKHPFLKVYHKGIEIENGKNNTFFARYIASKNTSNLARIETTVKNKKHWMSYGLDCGTLNDILSLNQSTLNEIMKESISRNLNPRIIITTKSNSHQKMTTSETKVFAFLSYITQKENIDRDEVISIYLSYFSDKQRRYRTKKECESVFDRFIQGKDYQKQANEGANFFKSIGWS